MNTQSTFTTRLTAILCALGCFLALLGGLLSLAEGAEIPLVSDTTVSDGVDGIAEGETSAVISITVTGDPNAPIDPTVTTDPTVTADPSVTTDPSETADPSVTTDPSETVDPSVTTDPSETVDPSITTDPSVTIDPALTTTEVTTTEPRPSTEPVTKTGAAQSRPTSPLSTDPGEGGKVTAQTVPGQTTPSTPGVSGNAPTHPSDSSAVVTTAPSDGIDQSNGTQAHDGFGIAIVGVVFAIAAIVSTVAVILTKYMKRS